MKISRKVILVAVTVMLASSVCLAQDSPADSPADPPADPPARKNNTSLPEVGDVMDVIEKATAPKTDGKGGDWSTPIRLAVVFTMLALLPSLLVMMTSFTRIVIVLSFVRRALTTQNIPPTIAIIGLSLFLSIFTMSPTFGKINSQALQPYLQNKLTFRQACEIGNAQLKDFMLRQTREGDLSLFVELSGIEAPRTQGDIPAYVAIPSFVISEFRTAFEMGCLLFIPFLLIDLVTAAILLSAGMMMLPPAIISLPFKIILFVLVDGWQIMARTLVTSFR